MSYSVNWITKVISVPTTDLILVSGNRYSLSMTDFLIEVRRLEWQFDQGMWAPDILIHTNTRFDFAGADYAPFDDLQNGYTVEFTGVATRVDLLGSNNDLIDVLIANGVSVVPSNSAGLVIGPATGVGTPQEVADAVHGSAEGLLNILASKIQMGRQEIAVATSILTIYDPLDDVTVLITYQLTDENDVASFNRIMKRKLI